MAATNIAQEISRLTTAKADLKTAIEGKGVTIPSSTLLDGYADLVDQIQQGGAEEAPEGDVNFYDYDGFRVASYTIAEAKALTALPTPPTHDGLTFQEWNWSLADIQSYNRRFIDIGANYVPTDGKTHIKCSLKGSLDVFITTYATQQSGEMTVEWGDGNSDTYTPTSSSFTEHLWVHTYAQTGEYDVKISTTNNYQYNIIQNDKTKWSPNLLIKEINAASPLSLSINYALAYLGRGILLSVDKNVPMSVIRGFMFTSCPIVVIPKNAEMSITGYYPFEYFDGKVCFPRQIAKMTSSGFIDYSTSKRIILPECGTDGLVSTTCFSNNRYADIISIPSTLYWGANDNYFQNTNNLRVLDIATGWIPNYSLTLSGSTMWAAKNIVDFFTKLGTTQTAITLTFGSTNLNKLTAEEKAIATNKGYTLA